MRRNSWLVIVILIKLSISFIGMVEIREALAQEIPERREVRKIYWGDIGTNQIQRANPDGSNIETVVTDARPWDLALDIAANKIYWVSLFNNRVRRANLDGSDVEDLVIGRGGEGISLDIAAGKMYWAGNGMIQRANLDGSGIESLITGLSKPDSMDLDLINGKVYWTDSIDGTIQRANLDGSSMEILVTGLFEPQGLNLDLVEGKMYWSNWPPSDKIQRANLDGSNIEDIAPGFGGLEGLALDFNTGKMYWTDFAIDKIQRANFDGSNIEDIVTTGLSWPISIIFESVPIPLTFTPSAIADQTFTVGTAVSLTLPSATGGTPPYTYTLSPIPIGLQFDTTTQLLSGTPTTATPATLATYTATDATGASASLTFTITVIDAPPLTEDKITGPWLWMIAPTEAGQGGAASTDIDSLAVASGGTVTEADVAANGANIGDSVGDYAWTLSTIRNSGITNTGCCQGSEIDNVTDVLLRIGWADGDVDDHSSYALITLESATVQNNVRMKVGSDDSIKVWLNGEVVHRNAVNRGARDFQDDFRVNLVAGDNLLLVKVSEGWGNWSMFVGIEADVNAVYKPPASGGLRFNPNVIADQTFTVGTSVSLTLPPATNGTPPYTYRLAPSLPAGLYFDPIADGPGYIGGTPTAAMPPTPFTYTATDATSASASLTFTITVTSDGTSNLDVNGDGQVTVVDLAIVALFYGTQVPAAISLPADVNADGVVDLADLTAVAEGIDAAGGGVDQLSVADVEQALLVAAEQAVALEAAAGAPMRAGMPRSAVSVDSAYRNVANALAAARSDVWKLHKGFAVLEVFLALLAEMGAIPETTALLPNYPNPFNPETWIPYHLTKDAEVIVRIYDMRGVAVRELVLGHQAAGVYQSRGRAAYWDGRNQIGEKVASGLYFYTLTAGDFTATRKLLIAK